MTGIQKEELETTKTNGLNVFQYLYTLLLYMPDYKDEPAGVEAMMPFHKGTLSGDNGC